MSDSAYAKNLVNRILRKSEILCKDKADGCNVVRVKEEFKRELLGEDTPNPPKEGL